MLKLLFARKLFLIGWLFIALVALSFLLIYGKAQSHIYATSFHAQLTDELFKYLTLLGHGLFIVMLSFLISFIRLRWFFLILLSFIISGLLAQILKNFAFPGAMRPVAFFDGIYNLHIIHGVKMLRSHSFPSGHSASAFALFFALAHITRRWHWEIFFLLMAFAVAYSRVYLSQHFLIDILAGSFLGIISVVFSLMILKRIEKPWFDNNLRKLLKHAD